METSAVVEVIHRNLRWEVAVDGVTRPRIDWFYSAVRAIDHARELASDLGAETVSVVQWDGTVDAVLPGAMMKTVA